MPERGVGRGDVLLARLPRLRPPGREQMGRRPVVVVALPPGKPRYPMFVVVPLTTQAGKWSRDNPALYPVVAKGCAGLPAVSVVLIDQIRSVDIARIEEYLGTLTDEEYAPVGRGIAQLSGD